MKKIKVSEIKKSKKSRNKKIRLPTSAIVDLVMCCVDLMMCGVDLMKCGVDLMMCSVTVRRDRD